MFASVCVFVCVCLMDRQTEWETNQDEDVVMLTGGAQNCYWRKLGGKLQTGWGGRKEE